jgi:hypothetical protein
MAISLASLKRTTALAAPRMAGFECLDGFVRASCRVERHRVDVGVTRVPRIDLGGPCDLRKGIARTVTRLRPSARFRRHQAFASVLREGFVRRRPGPVERRAGRG